MHDGESRTLLWHLNADSFVAIRSHQTATPVSLENVNQELNVSLFTKQPACVLRDWLTNLRLFWSSDNRHQNGSS